MAEDSLISKNTKQTVTFASALFFSFNILFFAPLEIYLGNMNDISVPLKYVLWGIALLYKTKEKYFYTAVSVVWGLGLAFYIQGNFLQINSLERL